MDPHRLPRHVLPTRYDIRLEPDLPTSTFTGEETITVTVQEPTTEILLNAVELVLDAAELVDASGTRHQATVTLELETERVRLTFDSVLNPGEGRLRLKFRGTLNDKLRGFYRSTYKDDAGQTQTLAATQFEATDARRAFPCWDEPSFKAVFASTLVIDPALMALSNTAIQEETLADGKKIVRFADTIPMSSYLVAYVVGLLEGSDPVLVGQTPLRVWCVPGKQKLTSFGQQIGAFSLRFYEEYYGQPYPGDKLDLIAIPDFAAGAMENLGAITFRETALLVDESTATHAERERVADVVAHENAHMWFGDLVTMAWWNGLWLNEAFATFLEMVAVDAWKPHWQRWTTFGVSRSAALNVDGLYSTRPIEYPVAAPKEAEAMFDVLTYEKGASILRMLEQYLGAEVFRAGVRRYLERHKFGNTETEDLWLALGEASAEPIPHVMDGWVFHPGYPVVTAQREGDELVLTQQRFSYLPAPLPGGEPSGHSEHLWHVPLQMRFLTAAAPHVERVLLREAEARVRWPGDHNAVLVNEGGHGFYRVRYSSDLLAAVLATLAESLTPIERFNLLNDAWASVLAGLMPLREYLDMTARFRTEQDRNVWTVLTGSLTYLHRIIDDVDRPRLEALVRDRLGPAVADLGWEPRSDESDLTRQLRGDLLRAQGLLGNDPDLHARAEQLFATHEAHPDAVDPNVWAALVAMLAHAGDKSRYDDFLGRFHAARTPQEEQRYLYALTAFRPTELVEQTLTRCLSGEVRTQDAPFVLRTMLLGTHSRALAWQFVKDNWEAMSRLYPVNGLRRMFEGVIGLARPAWEQDVHDFFRREEIDLGGRTLAQYLEQLRIAVTLRERELENLNTAL